MRYFIFFLLFFSPYTIYAWAKLPHMVIASIAYQHLKPSTRHNVDALVSVLHKEYPNVASFLQLSYWPNEIRDEEIGEYSRWHYIDQSWSGDGTPIKNQITTDNAVWAIEVSKPVLKNTQVASIDRARFLAFLTHIVGDIHQPLHASTRFSAMHPNGDAGGTEYKIVYQGVANGIHYFWDNGITCFNASVTQQNAIGFAKEVMRDYPPNYFGMQVNDLNPSDWAQEGLDIAKNFIYSVAENGSPSIAYIAVGKNIAEQRIALAGYRLAAILNQLLA